MFGRKDGETDLCRRGLARRVKRMHGYVSWEEKREVRVGRKSSDSVGGVVCETKPGGKVAATKEKVEMNSKRRNKACKNQGKRGDSILEGKSQKLRTWKKKKIWEGVVRKVNRKLTERGHES